MKFLDTSADTIAAIVTPPGRGGLGVIRVSGPEALAVGRGIFASHRADFRGFTPRLMHHGRLMDAGGRPLDDVLAVFMPGPRSYTGEDVLEFSCHGSPAILRRALALCLELGARQAGPGEFTRRAFLNGRMDLSQAQAVAELTAAQTPAGASLALERLEGLMGRRVSALRADLEALRAQVCLAVDFPEDELECLEMASFLEALDRAAGTINALLRAFERARPLREGGLAVLAGPVNAGKSSLLNALAGRERAIVSPLPGTTRDYLEEPLDLDGLPLCLADTAGLRDTDCPVEREGLARCRGLMARSAQVLLVVDGSLPFDPAALEAAREALGGANVERDMPALPAGRVLAVVNKCDLAPGTPDASRGLTEAGLEVVRVSARTGQGLEELCRRLRSRLLPEDQAPDEAQPAPNEREAALLRLALEELRALAAELPAGLPPDLAGVRLETACAHLSDITGEITSQAVLEAIFERFCIGK